jgi:hypothetical protein
LISSGLLKVVSFKLVESLPKNLKGSLPTVAEIEAELDNTRPK